MDATTQPPRPYPPLTITAWWPMPVCSCQTLARHLGLRELVDHDLT